MPRGDKSAYSARQKHQAERIEKRYEGRGMPKKEAAARAWATVNKQSGGGEKSGSGRTVAKTAKKAARKDSALRAAATRKGRSPNKGSVSKRSSTARRRTTTKTAAQRSRSKSKLLGD